MVKAKHFKTRLMASCVAVALSSVANAALVPFVDEFSTSQGAYVDADASGFTGGNTLPTTTTTLPPNVGADAVGGTIGSGDATILGGNRDMFVALAVDPGGAAPASIEVFTSAACPTGCLSFNNQSGSQSRGQVQWDGLNDVVEGTDGRAINYTGLSGVSFDPNGAFKVGVISADFGFRFDITLYTDDTHWTQVSLQSNLHTAFSETTIALAAFSQGFCDLPNAFPANTIPGLGAGWPLTTSFGVVNDINCGSGGAVDLNSIGAMVVDIDPLGETVDIDLRIDYIRTPVPEPGSVALLGAGLLGLFGVGRRFRKLA